MLSSVYCYPENKLKKFSIRSDISIPILLFALISYDLFHSFTIDKHLSIDAVGYFTTILDTGNFTDLSWSRQFAEYLTQWPLVFAVQMGIQNLILLKFVFAIGIYLPYLLSFLLCVYALRQEQQFLLAFPFLSIVGINLSVNYALAGEHHVMELLSWPILLLSLRRHPLTWGDGIILWLLLLLYSRTFESTVISALIIAAVLIAKLYRARHNPKPAIIYSMALALSIATCLIAIYFILYPADAANKSNFSEAIKLAIHNKQALATLIFSMVLTLGLIFRNRFLLAACILPTALYLLVIIKGHGLTAYESFSSRTLSLTLLPFLLICTILTHYFNGRFNRLSKQLVVLFILVIIVGDLRFSNNWSNFRHQVTEIVSASRGYIPIEQTVLDDNPYRWTWNNPGLSIVWSYPCVHAILLNSPDITWEPFNPHQTLPLKRYVSYDGIFQSVDSDINVCH
ncbi:MAG TPA: hypothetical protein V6C88_19080 [Chroococcidiopsis sp.]